MKCAPFRFPRKRSGTPRVLTRPASAKQEEQLRRAELIGVLEEEGLIVGLQPRLPEDVKEGHWTGAAPVREHQGVYLRLAHDDLFGAER